ncbi:hypothetical protein LLG95_04535 [bacterium]|nr:hypothetical protein [bacterium]
MTQATHYGDQKKEPLRSPLAAWERAYIDRNVVKLPMWLRSWQLTLLTLPFAAGLIVCGRLARDNQHWLWLSSALLAAQWWTDCMDGTLGRVRGEGLVKWGFYMDHFLDFLFMSATFIGWILMLNQPRAEFLMLMIMLMYQAMMVSSWLVFGATQKFKITYLGVGPTEIRLLCIVVNAAVIVFGKAVMSERALGWTLGLMAAVLVYIVIASQRRLWVMDKSNMQ